MTVTGVPTGRPMVFVHGFGCDQAMWRFVAPDFEVDHRVVLLDLVGSGRSDLTAYDPEKYGSLRGYARDVVEVCRELGLADVVFVGHSVSAMIGVLAANREPSRFGALILLGPSPRYINSDGYVGGFEQADIDGLLDTIDANYLGWSSAMAPLIMGNASIPQLGDELTESFCSTDPTVARHFAHVTFLSDNRHDLEAVTVKTLVLQSKDDIIAPLEVGTYVHEQIAGSSYALLDAYGHCANLSAPDEVAAEMRNFLR